MSTPPPPSPRQSAADDMRLHCPSQELRFGAPPDPSPLKQNNDRPVARQPFVIYQAPKIPLSTPVRAGLDPAISTPHQIANDAIPVSKPSIEMAGSSPAMTGWQRAQYVTARAPGIRIATCRGKSSMAHWRACRRLPRHGGEAGSKHQGRRKPTLTILHTSWLFQKFSSTFVLAA